MPEAFANILKYIVVTIVTSVKRFIFETRFKWDKIVAAENRNSLSDHSIGWKLPMDINIQTTSRQAKRLKFCV